MISDVHDPRALATILEKAEAELAAEGRFRSSKYWQYVAQLERVRKAAEVVAQWALVGTLPHQKQLQADVDALRAVLNEVLCEHGVRGRENCGHCRSADRIRTMRAAENW